MIRKVSAEDIAIRGNGTGLEYMCPTWHFVYIFFNPVFQVSTAKNEINLFNNHILIVAPVTFAPAGAMTPSAEFLSHFSTKNILWVFIGRGAFSEYPQHMFSWINKIIHPLLRYVFVLELTNDTRCTVNPENTKKTCI